MKETKIKLPEGWKVDRIENGEIILKETKKKLPETWKECLMSLEKLEYINQHSTILESNIGPFIINDRNLIPVGLGIPMLALCQLLVCREVYRQGWKPNWEDEYSSKYCIEICGGRAETSDYCLSRSRVLSFQSAEVRDKFLENFKDLIMGAKEFI